VEYQILDHINFSERSKVSTRTQTKKYGFTHILRAPSKMSFLLATASRSPSPTLRLPNLDAYLQENTEQLQTSRLAEFYLSCSKVRVRLKSSPIFPIVPCCFFVLLEDVKHGFLLFKNLIPPTLYQFWRTALPPWLKCATHKNGHLLLIRGS
jgi:hypothetical protein